MLFEYSHIVPFSLQIFCNNFSYQSVSITESTGPTMMDESDFESTKLGSLISDDQSSSIVIQISSDKKLKTEDNTNDMSVNHPDDDLSQVGLCAP